MPIRIPYSLPATETLKRENIFVMDERRASTQDIRPLKIAILNLMPTKIVTETQLLRLLSNTPLQVDVCLMTPETHCSKNTPEEHLNSFYTNFSAIQNQKFDGMIITGAPVEYLPFEEVDYWEELCKIMEWAKTNVYSTLYVCWGAYAGLYHNHGIQKYPLEEKVSGIYRHRTLVPENPLVRGFNTHFNAPHSRYSYVKREDVLACEDLTILADSEEAGLFLIASKNGRECYVTGHPEYDRDTLRKEYERDVAKGLDIKVPKNYFPEDDPTKEPMNTWRATAHLLYSNWLNYSVYQSTPFDIREIR
ncbi:MAG: homoserine O-succinyltransferase [Ruminococcaceae bacterium]|nr:homoserine O-succinyltransferase [Oscillospiraceae bacterium]